jgi:hypothetical protein
MTRPSPRQLRSIRAAATPAQRKLHQAQALETLSALQDLEELREGLLRLQAMMSPEEDPAFREELARRVGDLGVRLPVLESRVRDRLNGLLWLVSPALKQEVRSLVPKTRRDEWQAFLKVAVSGLPGPDTDPVIRPAGNPDAEMFGINTLNSGGSTPQQRREDKPAQESIFESPTGPKMPKTSPGGPSVDTKEWDFSLQYPNTRIPKVVRR